MPHADALRIRRALQGLLLLLLPLLAALGVQWQSDAWHAQGRARLLAPAQLDGRSLPLSFGPGSVPPAVHWDFELEQAPAEPWALLLQHRAGVRVWLDGQLLAQSASWTGQELRSGRFALGGEWLLATLPQQLLQDGRHRLSLQLGPTGPSGTSLSGLWVGPADAVRAFDASRQHWQLLRSATVFTALVVAGFLGLVAGVRQQEPLYAVSALMLVLLALLLCPYVLPAQPLPSPYWRMLLDVGDLAAKSLQLAVVALALGVRLPWRWLLPPLLLCMAVDAWAAWNNLAWGDFGSPWPWLALGLRAALMLAATALALRSYARHGGRAAAGLAMLSAFSLASWAAVGGGALLWPGRWQVVDANVLAHAGWVLGLATLLARHFVDSARRERELRAELEQELGRQRQALAEQYQALQRSERAQAAAGERQRLLQDLHDGLGSRLLTLRLMTQQEEGLAPEALQQALDECLLEMRLSVDALCDPDCDLPLLLANLRHRLQPALAAAGLALDWQVQSLPPLPALEGRGALELMRWLQEVFSNALRHASARQMLVRAELAAHPKQPGRPGILLLLADDGVGLPSQERCGRGLRNLRERAARLGAELGCESPLRLNPLDGGGPGTGWWLWWPLPAREPDRDAG